MSVSWHTYTYQSGAVDCQASDDPIQSTSRG